MIDFQDWIRSLSIGRSIEIKSDDSLVQTVKKRQQKKIRAQQQKGNPPPTFKSQLTKVTGVPKTMTVKPIQLLHKIGRMTTPAIPSLMGLSTIGAIFHYIWAIDPNVIGPNLCTMPNLYLSQEARNMNFHLKAMLSDNFGIGFAGLIMEEHFGASEHIDVEEALKCKIFEKRITKKGRKSPDLLFWKEPLDDQSHLYLVECKGTTTSLNQSYEQICAGTEQLPSIQGLGNPITSIVSATCLLKNGTVVNMIDPPAEENALNTYIVKNPETSRKQMTKLSLWKKFVYAFPESYPFIKKGKFGSIHKESEIVPDSEPEVLFYGNRERWIINGFLISVFRGVYSGFIETEDYPGGFDDWFGKFYKEYLRRYDNWYGRFEHLLSLKMSDNDGLYPGSITIIDPKDRWVLNIDASGTMIKISCDNLRNIT